MKTTATGPDLERALSAARRALLSARTPKGHWEGHLSSSALSTATAVVALARASGVPERGLQWLAEHQNADGGFGDTPDSPSNLSTTALAWAALPAGSPAFPRAEAWLRREVGELTAPRLAEAIARRYGEDRTFSVPILTLCALAGRFQDWGAIPRLPFELAALPRALFRWLNLRVVSYALPALIAIGQAHHFHHPSRNPLARLVRAATRKKTLRLLEAIQPASGGFLEAVPLTSFVTLSLAASGQADHPVTRKGAAFLEASARPDGSWPIDTNLATWVTTLSVDALSRGPGLGLPDAERKAIVSWLLGQQTRGEHPYTGSASGGWAWTDLSGGVPDGDDTSGALLALSRLGADDPEVCRAAARGVRWLSGLQNRDGGIPTFCRGWGKLPFDRSCPDLTAHAIRAWRAWGAPERAVERAFEYLVGSQRPDGAWVPLWFGNQRAPGEENPTYGTSRVLLCARLSASSPWKKAVERGIAWLLGAQNSDGGFGGAPGVPSTVEETALATEALAHASAPREAVARAARWLVEETEGGTRFPASPIGLYFAKLWYSERLYPVIWTVAALGRVLETS